MARLEGRRIFACLSRLDRRPSAGLDAHHVGGRCLQDGSTPSAPPAVRIGAREPGGGGRRPCSCRTSTSTKNKSPTQVGLFSIVTGLSLTECQRPCGRGDSDQLFLWRPGAFSSLLL